MLSKIPGVRRGPLVGAVAATVIAAIGVLAPAPLTANALPSDVRLNQMQVIATHNAYHIEPDWAVNVPAVGLAYSHVPLDQQFSNEKVRQVELDVHPDPDGLFRPLGHPGYKVFHIEGLDENATCETFHQCLQVIKNWSDAHPAHMPIGVQLEIKDGGEVPGASPRSPFMTTALFDALDAEITDVFPPERLITPDDIRGSHSTLEQAVLTDGWPRIDDVRGRMMFVMDNTDDTHQALYLAGHPSLQGRMIFVPSEPGRPEAAFLKMNDPSGANQALIAQRVAAGYMVRTRADDPVTTVLAGDTTQRDAALASGAQWVSTDYEVPGLSTRWNSTYVAEIPGGTPARCNPINAPADCTNAAIEDLGNTAVDPSTTTTTAAPGGTTPTTVSVAPTAVAAVPRFTG
jgi:hypothetical protein